MNWRKVARCKHKNLTDHYAWGGCGTPFCGGWTESHCRACGAFITNCPCGSNNGMGGWSYKRIKRRKRRMTDAAGLPVSPYA